MLHAFKTSFKKKCFHTLLFVSIIFDNDIAYLLQKDEWTTCSLFE